MRVGRSIRWSSGCFVFILGMGTGSPALGDSRYLMSRSARLPETPVDRATVYLAREQRAPLSPLPFERVYLDGQPAGILPEGSWLLMHLEPGYHRISGIKFCPDLVLACKPGRTYLLRLREVTDGQDRRTVNLLLDDPGVFRELIESKRLSFVEMTDRGMEYLRERRGSEPDPARSSRLEPGHRGDVDTMFHIIVEKPLDQVNLRREFSALTGRLILTRSMIRYGLEDSVRTSLSSWRHVSDIFDIRREAIVKVRFDGTRFTGVTPWVNIIYRSSDGLRSVSFADARESEGVDTYHRIFSAAQDLLDTYRETGRHAWVDSTREE